jgi:IS1 family transposase
MTPTYAQHLPKKVDGEVVNSLRRQTNQWAHQLAREINNRFINKLEVNRDTIVALLMEAMTTLCFTAARTDSWNAYHVGMHERCCVRYAGFRRSRHPGFHGHSLLPEHEVN